jgi:fibronectin type 3 domain-containing protein
LTANGGKKRVDLAWSASTDNVAVTGYRIYRATAASGPFTQVATTTTTSYGNGGLASRVTYYYYVVAVDAAGNVSAASNTASATAR